MWLKNAEILDGGFARRKTDLRMEGERIAEFGTAPAGEGVDCFGMTLIPGLIDIHTHACDGADSSDASIEELKKISRFEGQHGITSFLPTTVTLTDEGLDKAVRAIREFDEKGMAEGAYIRGIHMEGPYLSLKKLGAHKAEWIQVPNAEHFRKANAASGNRIKIVTVAPELPGALDFIREVKDEVKVSIAHTNADFDTAMEAARAGAMHFTHLYNAMSAFGSRAPGVVGAAFCSGGEAELICDCLHVHPAVINTTFRILGKKVIMISDSMAATGLTDGDYHLGGLEVFVRDGKATLADGTIAGSTTPLSGDLKLAVTRAGVAFEDVVYACTMAPALSLGAEKEVGSLEVGKLADIVALTPELDVAKVWVKGREIR